MKNSERLDPHWISGNAWYDLLSLSLPGFLVLAALPFVPANGTGAFVLTMIVSAFLDSGHVYTTYFRLLIYGRQSGNRLFLLWPLVVFSFFFLWTRLQIPYLWSFVLYTTIFHNLRQFYGFLRWYETLNGHRSRATHVCFYLLVILPVILYHFRENVPRGMYTNFDLFVFPENLLVHNGLLALYGGTWIFWALHELKLLQERGVEWNRIAAFFTPAILYGVCLSRGRTIPEVLYPLLAAHGIGYIFASVISVRRSKATYAWSVKFAIMAIVATAVVFGLVEGVFEENYLADFLIYWQGAALSWKSAVLALYLTPLMSHYTYDMWLWKSKHPDFKAIVKGMGLRPAGNN